MWKIFDCIPKAVRSEWFHCVKPAAQVVCSEEQEHDSKLRLTDICKIHTPWSRPQRGEVPVLCVAEDNESGFERVKAEEKPLKKEDRSICCWSVKPDELLPRSVRSAEHDGHSVRSAEHDGRTSTSDVPPSVTDHPPATRDVSEPSPSVAAPSSCAWFHRLAISLGCHVLTCPHKAPPDARDIADSDATRYHRHRWRHSFHRDFWSSLRQPYRYIEAVGWSTTLLLGLHLCDLRRQTPVNERSSWTSHLIRFATSTNDTDISASCKVLPESHPVKKSETTGDAERGKEASNDEESDPLDAMREAANTYRNMTYNSEALRLARAGRHGNAFALWERAAHSGYGKAHFNLALCYELGKAVTVDTNKAAAHYSAAADSGHVKAKYNLAVLYRDGVVGVSQPQGASSNHAGGASRNLTEGASRNHVVLNLFREAAEAGLVEAQLDLGCFYMEEMEDKGRAVDWFRKAADQKDETALSYLGLCYEHGLGVEQNMAAASDMYSRASNHGNPLAELHLGAFYENGLGGVGLDHQAVLRLYESSAAGGVKVATHESKRLRGLLESSSADDSEVVQFSRTEDDACDEDDCLQTSSSGRHCMPSSSSWSSSSEDSDDFLMPVLRGSFGVTGRQAAVAGPA